MKAMEGLLTLRLIGYPWPLVHETDGSGVPTTSQVSCRLPPVSTSRYGGVIVAAGAEGLSSPKKKILIKYLVFSLNIRSFLAFF